MGLFLVVTALAKGLAFLPKFSIDDYYILQTEPRPRTMIQQGRFGQSLLVSFLRDLQLDPGYSYIVFVVLAFATWALLSLAVVRWWGLRRGWLPFAAGCLIATHPFTTEIFTFRTALGTCTLALTFFTLLLLPRRWPPWKIALGAALFAFTLSIYQVVLHFALIILLLGWAVAIARYLVAGGRLGWSDRWARLGSFARLRRHRLAAFAACIGFGTVFYLLVNQVILAYYRFPQISRTQFLPLAGVGKRITEVRELLHARLLLPDPLLSPIAQRFLLVFLAVAVAGLLLRKGAWTRLRSATLTWTVLGLLAAGLVWSIGLILVLQEFWAATRVMSHIGIFWAGVLAIAWVAGGRWLRPILAFLAALVVLSFVGTDNRILDEQLRINQRDAMMANRILTRLESLPRAREIETLVLHGGSWRFPLRMATTDHDMNISAFGADWAKVQLLREVSGYDWKWGPNMINPLPGKELKEQAESYCRGVEPWPSAAAVTQQGSVAIVCLPPPP